MNQTTDRQTLTLAILFADISGSTRLYETLGNSRAQRIVDWALGVLRDALQRHRGVLIKTIGDEIMCTFGTAADAATAATDMQRSLKQAVAFGKMEVSNLTIRVGFHHGPVIRERGDVFGDAVNVAARVVAQAKAGQILTTRESLDTLGNEFRTLSRYIDRVRLKGKTDELELLELLWETENLTVVQEAAPNGAAGQAITLRLLFRDREMVMDRARPVLKLGRGSENDIVVPEPLASRLHARIEYARLKFVLIDQSMNGTYLHVEGEPELCLRRDEAPLRGKGVIGLGRSTQAGDENVVRFVFEG